MERVWRPSFPVDVRRTLGPLRRGAGDPCHRVDGDGAVWRTARTPEGVASYRVLNRGSHEIACTAWGPGAQWVLDGLPELLGEGGDLTGFVPAHSLLERTHALNAGLRIPRTRCVMEALVPAVLEQKVTGKEARSSWRWLVSRYGEPAPGPAPLGMYVAPEPGAWAMVPSWDWHRAAVDPKRSRTIVEAARVASRLEEAVGMAPAAAAARLSGLPGIGPWTVAEVAQRALGDTDALSVGDYHLSQFVGWVLVGRPLDDDGMVEVLEPWRPYRYLVVRLLEVSGVRKPRFGPRLTIQEHRTH